MENETEAGAIQAITAIIRSGQFKTTSPDLTRKGGLYRESYQHGLKLGIGIVLNYPGSR